MTAAEKVEAAAAESGAVVGMEGAVALRSLTLRNVLSFGAEAKVELGPLNVLIGPNGCGKSNLMDVIALLKAAATGELSDEFRGGGADWPWKGGGDDMQMQVESEWGARADDSCRHQMNIVVDEFGAYSINSEVLASAGYDGLALGKAGKDGRVSILRTGTPLFGLPLSGDVNASAEEEARDTREAEKAREVVSGLAGNVCVYRGRHVGRAGRGQNPLRVAGRADAFRDKVSESLDNFPNVLNRIYADPACRDAINEKMRDLNEDARGIYFDVAHGHVAVALQEAGNRVTPAARMSDGMLNWLFLLTILLDPNPPALVCIDEPETGLHMDLFITLSELLRAASARTQIVITTHSDMLVDCFTHEPEAVVVCDKVDGVTQMKRLCAEDFQDWKEEGLGMAWVSGAVGGKRW